MGKIHFIAIGGVVMHQLAIDFQHKGYTVTGSDDIITGQSRKTLLAAGLLPSTLGWYPSRITPDLDAVILGNHARLDNPEIIQAQKLNLKILSFPELVANHCQEKKRVAVAGSHGKSTITSMILHTLRHLGRDFDYLVGASLDGFHQSVKLSEAPLIVCEADEYPTSPLDHRPKFCHYRPHVAVLSGIGWDHINVYPTLDVYIEQFAVFVRRMEAGGTLVYHKSDPLLQKVVEKEGGHLRLVGYDIPQHELLENSKTRVRLEEKWGEVRALGDHNLLNANAAYLVCKTLGVSESDFISALSDFVGAKRRLEVVAQNNNTKVFLDFAHAPSKVRASVRAVKKHYSDRKIVALLELHTFSSLNSQFIAHYCDTLELADDVAVFYSPHVLESKRLPKLEPDVVVQGFGRPDLLVLQSHHQLSDFLGRFDGSGQSIFLLMSSSDFGGFDFSEFYRSVTHTTAHNNEGVPSKSNTGESH